VKDLSWRCHKLLGGKTFLFSSLFRLIFYFSGYQVLQDWLGEEGRDRFVNEKTGEIFEIHLTIINYGTSLSAGLEELRMLLDTLNNTYVLGTGIAGFDEVTKIVGEAGRMVIFPENGHRVIYKNIDYGLSLATAFYKYVDYFSFLRFLFLFQTFVCCCS